jgi:hypothetical protein
MQNFREVFAWGSAKEGQLGLGENCIGNVEPTKIGIFSGRGVRKIVIAEEYSHQNTGILALTESGRCKNFFFFS